jgi:hypothetical protein
MRLKSYAAALPAIYLAALIISVGMSLIISLTRINFLFDCNNGLFTACFPKTLYLVFEINSLALWLFFINSRLMVFPGNQFWAFLAILAVTPVTAHFLLGAAMDLKLKYSPNRAILALVTFNSLLFLSLFYYLQNWR